MAYIIDLLVWVFDFIQAWWLVYTLFFLITWLLLIRLFVATNGYGSLNQSMGELFRTALVWPYVLAVFVIGLPVFSWAFWLKPLSFKLTKVI